MNFMLVFLFKSKGALVKHTTKVPSSSTYSFNTNIVMNSQNKLQGIYFLIVEYHKISSFLGAFRFLNLILISTIMLLF
jgi:hypothetical protein